MAKGAAGHVRVRKPRTLLADEWTAASQARLESLSAPRVQYVLEVPPPGHDDSDMSEADGHEDDGSDADDAVSVEEDGNDANPVEAAPAAAAAPPAKKLTKAEQVKATSAAEEAWWQQNLQNVPVPAFTGVATGPASSDNTRASVQNSSLAMPY